MRCHSYDLAAQRNSVSFTDSAINLVSRIRNSRSVHERQIGLALDAPSGNDKLDIHSTSPLAAGR